jgi:tRNA 2-thiocytidine biosynthesis protein TtcA
MSQASNTAQEFSPGTAGKTSVDNRKSSYNHNKLRKRLRRLTGQAIADYNMIEEGDRVMVCLSGGKDSYTMLDILLHLQRSAPIQFEIIAVNLDQKQPGFPEHVLPEYLESLGVPYYVLERDTYSVVRSVIPREKQPAAFAVDLDAGHFMALLKK